MPIAIEHPIQQKPITLEEFLIKYGDDDRYELIDGEVFDLEPTGPHEEVAAFIDRRKQATLNICTLGDDGYYDKQQLLGTDKIVSRIFPSLTLAASQVLSAGQQC